MKMSLFDVALLLIACPPSYFFSFLVEIAIIFFFAAFCCSPAALIFYLPCFSFLLALKTFLKDAADTWHGVSRREGDLCLRDCKDSKSGARP